MNRIPYALILFLVIFIRSIVTDDKCIVKHIEVQNDFNPDLFEGKWFVISVTKLWGRSFMYSRGGKRNRQRINTVDPNTTRSDVTPLNMQFAKAHNTKQEGSSFSHQITKGVGSLRSRTRPKFSPILPRLRNSQFPGPMSTRSSKQISPDGKWNQRMGRRQFSGRNWTTPDGGLSMWSSNRTRAGSRDMGGWRGPGNGFRRRGWGLGSRNETIPPWVPQNVQLVYKSRDDRNLDIYVVNEVMTRCMLTRGIGMIENFNSPAKLLATFPIRMFSPCQPYWILKTDYTGYAVVYFCLKVLPDGSCEEDKKVLWTMNRKMTGHTSEELQKVQNISSKVCVDPNSLRQIVQDSSCHIQKEIGESEEKSPSIKCNDFGKVNMEYAKGEKQSHSHGHNVSNSLTFTASVHVMMLIIAAILY